MYGPPQKPAEFGTLPLSAPLDAVMNPTVPNFPAHPTEPPKAPVRTRWRFAYADLVHAVERRTSRASGAGGQHVNKTDSKVELVLDLLAVPGMPALALERLGPTLSVVVQKHRSQFANLREAEELLLQRLHAAMVVEAPRIPTRTPRSADRRRLVNKALHAAKKAGRSGSGWSD